MVINLLADIATELHILNELRHNVVEYLPYGITTLEMRVQGSEHEVYGLLYPDKRPNREDKTYIGYADESKDFLVLWGAGNERGLEINAQNISKRLFFQVLHTGNSLEDQNLTLRHSRMIRPIGTIKLIPAEKNENLVRMEVAQEGECCSISFRGSRVPIYYSRWFPIRPSEKRIQYYDLDPPSIRINFKVKEDNNSNNREFFRNIDSDISILLDNKEIAKITEDWHYSWPHIELFTIFGDSSYLVLRLWLCWIRKKFSDNIFLGGDLLLEKLDNPPENEQTRRGWLESFDIECPDIERFDFLIDMRAKKIAWIGTDFHYQESWYKFESQQLLEARIAGDVSTLEQVFKRLRNRMGQPTDNYDPMTLLRKILKGDQAEENLTIEAMPPIKKYIVPNTGNRASEAFRAGGITRKHIPYAERTKQVAELVSSVVTS
jgi:hypothetical protein